MPLAWSARETRPPSETLSFPVLRGQGAATVYSISTHRVQAPALRPGRAEGLRAEWEVLPLGAEHPSIPLLLTVPGVGWVLAYTIASEIGDIARFASPKKLTGYTGLCPLVRQSGNRDVRGPLAKNGPKYLRWALIEAATHAARHPAYRFRYERTKQRLGRQRGAKVARVELARRLAEAIWHILTKHEPFAPAGPTIVLVA